MGLQDFKNVSEGLQLFGVKGTLFFSYSYGVPLSHFVNCGFTKTRGCIPRVYNYFVSQVGYDKDSKIPSISNGYKELKLTVYGKETSVEAVNINGNNFVPIRSLVVATGKFDFNFENGEVVVKTK